MMTILTFEPKIPENKLSKLLSKELLGYCDEGYEFRKEYQPQCIASVLDSFEEKQKKQFHLGCGAGKTDIFLLPTLHYLAKSVLNNALLTAPRLALIAQHVRDIEKLIINGKNSGVINKDFILHIVEISSKGQKLKEKDVDLESEEVDNIDEEDYKKLTENENIIFIRSKNNQNLISKYLKNTGVLFVGCIPSVQKTFLPILKKFGTIIDVCINDEYHNLISQSDKKDKKVAFKELFSYCNSVLSFSATPRRGKVMSSAIVENEGENIFGEEVANISTAHLKQYGYLKRHFKVIFVEAGTTHSVSSADRAAFEALKIDPQQFYQEWNIILKVISEMVLNEPLKMPHILTATSRVAVIEQLLKNENFKAKVFELLSPETLINIVTGNTCDIVREEVFEVLRKASKELASLTMQHSVIAEGINVTNFNVAILLRGMNDVVMNQFINRITRNHKDYDTSYIYIQIDRDAEGSYKHNIERFLKNLLIHGLSLADIDVESISISNPGGSGDGPDDDNVVNVVSDFKYKSLTLELEEVLNDKNFDDWSNQIDEMDIDSLEDEFIKALRA